MKQRLWAGAALFTAVTGGMDHFISAAALKAPPCGREWICISKKPILCLDRSMFLSSKHSVVNVKEVNVSSKNLNNLDSNIYVLN